MWNNKTHVGIILVLLDVHENKATMIVPMEMVNHFKDCSKCDSIDIQDIEGCIRALVEEDKMTNQLYINQCHSSHHKK